MVTNSADRPADEYIDRQCRRAAPSLPLPSSLVRKKIRVCDVSRRASARAYL